ncbi:unnamed protein product [Schistosoma spindalis]|nr:unnamed protein product [Schistosoma spindale]
MNRYLHYDQYTLSSSQEVEAQLDILNKTSTQINDLERRLEISRDVYRKVLSDQSDKLQKLSKKLGKCILRTRPYNELKQKQMHYRKEIQLAALKYENAISTLNAARDTLAKLEARVSESGVRDPNTLESLNQSITDFNNANKSLNNAKLEHEKLMEIYATNEQSLRCLEKRLRFDIQKAKPYYTMYDHFMLKMEDAKTHVELCTDKLKACKIIYSDAMCKLELLSDSIHIRRLNQTDHYFITNDRNDHTIENDHSNNKHFHGNNNNNNKDDYVIMKSFTKQYESIQYTNEYLNNKFEKDNILNQSINDCLNVTTVNDLKMDNNDHDNSTVNYFPIMNGLLESLHQASIEIDSLQNSPFLSSIHSKDYSNSITNSDCTTIDTNTTTNTTSSSCTENNSYTESLSLSSHTSSTSISPALSFDTFTTTTTTTTPPPPPTTTTITTSSSPSSSSLFDEQSSTLMLINSFNNFHLTNNLSPSFISKEICCSNFTITNSS